MNLQYFVDLFNETQSEAYTYETYEICKQVHVAAGKHIEVHNSSVDSAWFL